MQSRGLDNNHSRVDCYGYLRNLPPWVSLSINRGKTTMRKEKIQIPYINKENMTVKDMIACVEMLRSILEVFDRDCTNDTDYDEMLERVGGRVWQVSKYVEVKE